jgi:hypothetical protein
MMAAARKVRGLRGAGGQSAEVRECFRPFDPESLLDELLHEID